MSNALEQLTAEIGRHFFLREFSYDANKFFVDGGAEFELADHVLALPRHTVLFQLKERSADAPADAASLQSWFEKKVLKKGCSQLAASLQFLAEQPALSVVNQRGHRIDLAPRNQAPISILSYSSPSALPESAQRVRHKMSKEAGFVHVLSVEDLLEICATLMAPYEFVTYFEFREKILKETTGVLDEPTLVAMFITDSTDPLRPERARDVLVEAREDSKDFDFGPIFRKFGDNPRSHNVASPLDYYAILETLVELNRAELRSFRKLFNWARDAARDDRSDPPCRLRGVSGVGIVVFPVPRNLFDRRLVALQNFTMLLKHDWKLDAALGVSIAFDDDGVEIDWALSRGPWTPDPDLDAALEANSPFRPEPDEKVVYRYPGCLTAG